MQSDELERLSRNQLIERAESLGVERAEVLTRVELVDEIIRRTIPDPIERRIARGLMGVARDLVARVVERGLHLPDAAARIRARSGPGGAGASGRGPIATVTLAEIYSAQGHRNRALNVLDEVLEREPDHLAARQLRDRIAMAANRDEPVIGPEREEGPEPTEVAESPPATGQGGEQEDPGLRDRPTEIPASIDEGAPSEGSELAVAALEESGLTCALSEGSELAVAGLEESGPTGAPSEGSELAVAGLEESGLAGAPLEGSECTRSELEGSELGEGSDALRTVEGQSECEEVIKFLAPRESEICLRHDEAEPSPATDSDAFVPPTLRDSSLSLPVSSSSLPVSSSSLPPEAFEVSFPMGRDPSEPEVTGLISSCPVADADELSEVQEPPETATESRGAESTPVDSLCIWTAQERGDVLLEWLVSADSVHALRAERGAGELVLRFLAVVPTWEGPLVQVRDRQVEGGCGRCTIRQLPEQAELRAAIGWRWKDGFQPIAVALESRQMAFEARRAGEIAGEMATQSETSWTGFGSPCAERVQ